MKGYFFLFKKKKKRRMRLSKTKDSKSLIVSLEQLKNDVILSVEYWFKVQPKNHIENRGNRA